MWRRLFKRCNWAEPRRKPAGTLRASVASRLAQRWWAAQLQRVGCLLALALASYLIIRHCVVESVQVVGTSMQPTLTDSEWCLVNRLAYLLREPRVGEVVVIRDPIDGGLSVKRIVGGPGDSVGFINGHVLVNGVEIKELGLDQPLKARARPSLRTDVPTVLKFHRCKFNEFFVLGDDLSSSVDSRYYGPIRREDILGMVIH
ncbi:MAG: signal peptidase I [Verrucomicrobiae bacterium]|nr:signal peptidase I [Verrucomicrobiae bacterium]